jgi:ubiquinone/menaquinone biosynthesis C-methylase UbiE
MSKAASKKSKANRAKAKAKQSRRVTSHESQVTNQESKVKKKTIGAKNSAPKAEVEQSHRVTSHEPRVTKKTTDVKKSATKAEPKQSAPQKTSLRQADQYNDPSHNYQKYWQHREYEDAAERLAISRLLAGKHFRHAVDVGGGYGRLCIFLEDYADKVTLAEPSQQQLDIAKDFLKDHKKIERKLLQAADLQFPAKSVDLLTTVRIWHHLPDPAPELKEISRVLSDGGYFVMEFANYTHFRNRLKYMAKARKFPEAPVDIRSPKNRNRKELPFVNHNPKTLVKQLDAAGLKVEKTLSVSNLRSPALKKVLPKRAMLALEQSMQRPFAASYFGPSIFFLVRKKKK